jgi:hypothetical protein
MKKIALLFSMLFVLAVSSQLKAQNYNSAIGLRFGYPLSVSYKFFKNESHAIELYGGYRGFSTYSYFALGALYEIHKPISDVAGLSWYYGAGLSAVFWNYDYTTEDGGFSVGLSGVIGLDYAFSDAPFNLSLDFIPTFLIGGYSSGGYYSTGALSARYILN